MELEDEIATLLLEFNPLMPSSGMCPFTFISLTRTQLNGLVVESSLESTNQLIMLKRTDFSGSDLIDYITHTEEYNTIPEEYRDAFLDVYKKKAQHHSELKEWSERTLNLGLGIVTQLANSLGLRLKPVNADLVELEIRLGFGVKSLKAYKLFDVSKIDETTSKRYTDTGIIKMNTMNITIFGGTGPSGLLTIQKALSKGHYVTVYARSPDKISIRHARLKIVEGELNNAGKISEAIHSADAVISLLGPKAKSKDPVIANGYQNIINTMHKDGPKRLIAAVSSSYRDPNDKFQFMVEFGIFMLKILAPGILKDILTTGELIRGSQLNWTIARLPMLKDKPAVGNVSTGYTGDGKFNFFQLTRPDLADFLVKQVDDQTYLRQAPAISNPSKRQ